MGKNIGFVYFLVAEEVKYFGSMIKYEGPLLIFIIIYLWKAHYLIANKL